MTQRWLSVLTVVGLVLGLSSLAGADTRQDRLERVEKRLGRATGQLDGNLRRTGVLTGEIEAFNARIRPLESRLTSLGGELLGAETRLRSAESELGQRRRALRTERVKLTGIRVRLERARKTLAERLVALYKADNPDPLTVVLEADGFAQMLENAEFLERVGAQDERVVNAVRDARAESERQEANLADLERQQQEVTSRLAAEHERIAGLEAEVRSARSALAAQRQARRQRLRTIRVSSGELRGEVDSLRRAQSRLTRTLAATAQSQPDAPPAAPVQSGSGGWVWPVSGTITSPFCEVRSYESCHPGLDIAAADGTPIRAARSGRVVLIQSTAASGGYGNLTCVQHDAATTSCYAHQSRFGTTSGATVTSGQVIGYIGSTGNSTGPHLHFEIRVNRSVVDPLNYL